LRLDVVEGAELVDGGRAPPAPGHLGVITVGGPHVISASRYVDRFRRLGVGIAAPHPP